MDHVVVRERQRVHADEAVELLERWIGPGKAGVEAERLTRLLQRGVEPHVGVVPDRLVAGGGGGGEPPPPRPRAEDRRPPPRNAGGGVEKKKRPLAYLLLRRVFSPSPAFENGPVPP